MIEYNKIQTIFKRDEHNIIIPGEFTWPEFELLKDIKWQCTEKIDGTNTSIHIIPTESGYEVEFHGRTERAQMPPHLLKRLEELFPYDKLIDVFTEGGTKDFTEPIILYGEGYGAKIQKGGNYIKNGCDFILFDIKIGRWWLERLALEEIAEKLGIKVVPYIGDMTIAEACDFVDKGFKSTIAENPDYDAEGLVLKAPYGLLLRNGGRLMTKIKSCDFRQLRVKNMRKDISA